MTLSDVRPASARPLPRVGALTQLRGMRAMRDDPVTFLHALHARHGDIAQMRVLGFKMVMINHPDHYEHVLVRNAGNYSKDTFLFHAVDPILRGGLINNAGGEPWRRQRRIMSPSFRQPMIAKYTTNMTTQTSWLLERWETQYAAGDLVNVSSELGQLAMRIVFGALFGAEVGDRAQEIEDIGLEANALLGTFFRFPFPPLTWPTPRGRRLRAIIGEIDDYVLGVVHERLQREDEQHDLLEALMQAVDSEDGTGMAADMLHKEVINLMVGGYETTSNSVSWLLHLVGGHADVQARLQAEVDDVLGGRVPEFEDLPKLTYTRMIVDEMLRMYTPAWQTMRRCEADDEIGGYRIPAGTDMYLNLYMLHRHPEFWPDPARFDPERFTPENIAGRPKSVYLPFGAGPRNCIGKHFARTELTLILAMLAGRYRFEVPPEHRNLEINPLVTLTPKGGVHLRMFPR